MAEKANNRGPGRPTGDRSEAVKQKLLTAARELCIEVGFDAVSTKTIAERAGVNPAMINYYFDGKEGLTQAMLQSVIAPLIAQLESLEYAGVADSVTLEQFMRGYMMAVAANPWIPQLVIREVLPPNGRFRELFLTELGERAGRLVPALLARERAAGRLTKERDPQLSAISVVSLTVFPFMAASLLQPILGIDMTDRDLVERLVEHSITVARQGLGANFESEE